MEVLKSSGIYLNMFVQLYEDVADSLQITIKERRRDLDQIQKRFRSEGLSFLTKQLPRLGKCLDEALARGTQLATPYFSSRVGSPKLFGAIWRRVFDEAGNLRELACALSVNLLRQLCYYLYKLELETPDAVSEKTLSKFEATDAELPEINLEQFDEQSRLTIQYARVIVHHCLSTLNWRDIQPRHGPGAVATGERTEEKAHIKRFYPSLNAVFPYDQYFVSGICQLADDPYYIDRMETVLQPTAKVVLVPKDSRGPRIISCEPLEIQWIQQGLMQAMVARIESHEFTSGYVNFTDQTVNQRLALESSNNGKLGTFDMKDASDRVSLDLVKTLFASTSLLEGLLAARSTRTRLPNGRVVVLKKFAPMGSAVCFPVEAICFFALTTAARYVKHAENKYRFSLRNAMKYRPYVYGDDIVFDIQDYDVVNSIFDKVGLAFNQSKCCVGDSFRESCGVDAFRGVNVTPLRCKATWSVTSAKALLSYVAHGNAAYKRGYLRLAEYLQRLVEGAYGPLPFVEEKSPAFGWVRDVDVRRANKGKFKVRTSSALCKSLILSYVFKPLYVSSKVRGWKEVLRNINGSFRDASGRYAMRRRIVKTRRWTPFTV